jgi:hypothetical protein
MRDTVEAAGGVPRSAGAAHADPTGDLMTRIAGLDKAAFAQTKANACGKFERGRSAMAMVPTDRIAS